MATVDRIKEEGGRYRGIGLLPRRTRDADAGRDQDARNGFACEAELSRDTSRFVKLQTRENDLVTFAHRRTLCRPSLAGTRVGTAASPDLQDR